MRIVAVEEHCVYADLLARIDSDTLVRNGWPAQGTALHEWLNPPALADIGEHRIAAMDAAGISMQALSVPGPGAELVVGNAGIAIAREYNDRLGRLIAAGPKRFCAFAHLPMMTPTASAEELERAVTECGLIGALINGTVNGRFLDSAEFEPVLECAERLNVPLYVHPSIPPQSVRSAYYDGLPGYASFALSNSGWGWHAETALHILRLALSGALERHPRLKLLIGHMGEGLPAMIERVERVFAEFSKEYLGRNAARAIIEQVWVSTSGFTGIPAFLATLMTFGADRMVFSVDYPFGNNRATTDFLRTLPLSPSDLRKIAHANADEMLGLLPSA
jgi:hypothetical protein